MVSLLYDIKDYLYRNMGILDIDRGLEKIITTYYKLTPTVKSGIRKRKRERKVIISFTTIPSRVDKVWITVESLLRQTCKPDEIILWLAKDEFEGKDLPISLVRQMKRGLTIRYCDNLKSYKKFFYTMQENPDSFVITVDDDIIYAEKMLELLLKTYRENPGCVICHRSHLIRKSNGNLLPYCRWTYWVDRKEMQTEPSFQNFFTSGGGTLFPVFLLDKRVFWKEVFLERAPLADDVWLNLICWLSGLKIKNTESNLGDVILIASSSEKGLLLENVVKNKNDEQMKAVLDYFNIDINDYI